MEIIRESKVETTVEFVLSFRCAGTSGSGYGFPCDEKGNVNESELADSAKENLALCRAGGDDKYGKVISEGVQRREHSYRNSAVGRCDCGHEVELHGFTNTCYKCGADYNVSGQRLAPRSQWGEETGEHLSDILNIP